MLSGANMTVSELQERKAEVKLIVEVNNVLNHILGVSFQNYIIRTSLEEKNDPNDNILS